MLKRGLSYLVRKGTLAFNALTVPIKNMIRRKLVERIMRQKKHNADKYSDCPNITAIIQFFNKKANIRQIITNLLASDVDEIIAIDDGSIDGSYSMWPGLLRRPNDFLLRCNDIYEVRTYDRAIRMANGEIAVLLQDDDILPADYRWIRDAMTLFENFPDLVVLGGREGLSLYSAEPEESQIIYPTRESPFYSYPGLHKYEIISLPQYIDPNSKIPFQFVETVNRAPMFIRTKAFLKVGGIPLEYAPIMCDDVALCLRVWEQGGQVELYSCKFGRFASTGGMRDFNQGFAQRCAGKNWRRLYGEYSEKIASGEIREIVKKHCERQLLKRAFDSSIV